MTCIVLPPNRRDTAVDYPRRLTPPGATTVPVGRPDGTVSLVREPDSMDADAVLAEWHDRSGEFSPGYYAYYGPNETSERLHQIFDAGLEPDAAILELGCSSGRHLSHLLANGYRNVSGIEINRDAFEVMKTSYPDLARTGTFYFDAIEHVIQGFDDREFDAVFSVETLQHLHPDNAWVFEEIARITDEWIVTVEIEEPGTASGHNTEDVNYVNEDFPLYYRSWNRVFTSLGFSEVETELIKGDTLRRFHRIDD